MTWCRRISRVFLLALTTQVGMCAVASSSSLAAENKTPAAADSGLTDAQKQDLYSQAKENFRQAEEAVQQDPEASRELYKRAALRFERLVREGGIQNGRLYYNIANTHMRLGDVGRAILNYRRAEEYIAGDPNLQQNLAHARSRRQDQVPERQRTKVLKTLLFWHYDLSPGTRSVLFTVSFLFFWLVAGVRLFSVRMGRVWLLVSAGILWMLFLGSLVVEDVTRIQVRQGVVLADEVVGRKGDGKTYQPSFKEPLHAGTEFLLVEERLNWYQIELSDGRRSWIPNKSAELLW